MNEEQSLAKLSELIPDIATAITVKYNVPVALLDDEEKLWKAVDDRVCFATMWLAKEVGIPRFSSVGLHLDGIKGKPHVHMHYICDARFEIKTAQARSNSKTRFIKTMNEDGMEWGTFSELSFKFAPLDPEMPKWQILAYPLKERMRSPISRHYYYFKGDTRKEMPKVLIDALENVGGAIFDATKALRERQDAHKARRLNNLQEMYKFALENRSKFKTFREMREFFEDTLLSPKDIDLEDIPVIKNYNNNVFIVGKKLGLVRYCDYDP